MKQLLIIAACVLFVRITAAQSDSDIKKDFETRYTVLLK